MEFQIHSIFKSISVFIVIISLFCFFFIFVDQFFEYSEFCEKNESYIVTVNDEVIYCQSIDYNRSYSLLFGSSDNQSYITLQIDDNTYRNIPKVYEMFIETVYEVDEPTFGEYLIGDY